MFLSLVQIAFETLGTQLGYPPQQPTMQASMRCRE